MATNTTAPTGHQKKRERKRLEERIKERKEHEYAYKNTKRKGKKGKKKSTRRKKERLASLWTDSRIFILFCIFLMSFSVKFVNGVHCPTNWSVMTITYFWAFDCDWTIPIEVYQTSSMGIKHFLYPLKSRKPTNQTVGKSFLKVGLLSVSFRNGSTSKTTQAKNDNSQLICELSHSKMMNRIFKSFNIRISHLSKCVYRSTWT